MSSGGNGAHELPDQANARIGDVLKFYIPLAATSVLMMVTHSVISGAVSRTADPVAALAAYSTAYSVGQILESPCYGMQRMGLTFIRGKRSLGSVYKVSLAILSILLSAYAIVAWTPLASYVFKQLLRVPDSVYPFAVASFRVFILWPTTSAVRSLFQPRIVLAKKTYWLTVNMLVRVAVMFGVAMFLPGIWPAGPVGATILVSGITTEAVLAILVVRFGIPPQSDEPEGETPATSRQVLKFALPLAFAASAQTFGRPVLTASLLRTLDPAITLAGYQVAASFSYIFVALTYNIYHAVVVYVKDAQSFRAMRAFCLGLGALGFFLMAICSIPPVGAWIFGSVIGAPKDIGAEALRTLSVLTFTAPTAASMEFYSGVLMMRRRASTVTMAKLINMGSTCIIAIVLVKLFPSIGGIAGAAALATGPFIEAVISYRVIRTSPEFKDLIQPVSTGARVAGSS
ncbi:MAG: hypothetical protein ACM3WU_10490 [Bacillota bacterium]